MKANIEVMKVITEFVLSNEQEQIRENWKKAYRLARNPDTFLASDLVLDFPVHYLIFALQCVNFKLGKGSFKNLE